MKLCSCCHGRGVLSKDRNGMCLPIQLQDQYITDAITCTECAGDGVLPLTEDEINDYRRYAAIRQNYHMP